MRARRYESRGELLKKKNKKKKSHSTVEKLEGRRIANRARCSILCVLHKYNDVSMLYEIMYKWVLSRHHRG